MLRMKDVARHAGVSVATVSNVITGKKPVSPAITQKVLASISDLNYQVNIMARGLKTQQTFTLGIVLPDVTKLFFMDVIRGIMDVANQNGYSVNILSSSYDLNTERQHIGTLRSSRVDGIILDSCIPLEHSETWIDELMADQSAPPIVALESKLAVDRISSVVVENQIYSGRITQHLIDGGARRIFFISGPRYLEHEYERLLGYQKTLEKNGLPRIAELESGGDYLSGTGYRMVKKALSEGIDFDAVQATNDQAAVGALKALRENGIDVPGQVALAGFDNLFASTLVSPAITTVNVPRYDLGSTAVTELLRLITDKDAHPICHILPANLILRSSSSRNAQDEWDLENW